MYLEILRPQDLAESDLIIVAEATFKSPGQAKLNRARLGQKDPAAPNALPVFSQTGVKIGYVADDEPIPPFKWTYTLTK
jgi:hypothetical protein